MDLITHTVYDAECVTKRYPTVNAMCNCLITLPSFKIITGDKCLL